MTTLSLVNCLSVIRNPRQESKIEHELIDILVLCVFGVICGAEGWQDIEEVGHSRPHWLQKRQGHPLIIDSSCSNFVSALEITKITAIE